MLINNNYYYHLLKIIITNQWVKSNVIASLKKSLAKTSTKSSISTKLNQISL